MTAPTNVLITGATGFIGQHVTRQLRDDGHQILALSRSGGAVDETPVVQVDLADAAQLRRWANGKAFDAIIHLAADIPAELTGPIAENSFRANTGAMLNVLSLAAERRAHLIYASSTSVYGNTGNHFSEDSAARPNNLYSTSKYVGDVLCRQQFEREALGFTSLRLSAPFGPGCRHRTVLNIFLESALRGDELSLFGSGERTQDFTYVADVVEAFRLALSRRPVGIFNIASGRPVSMKELAETIIEMTGSNSKTVFSGEPDPEENYRANLEVERARKELSWVANWSLRAGLAVMAEALRAVQYGSAA